MAIGDPAFTSEELDAEFKREEEQRREYEAKLANGFFKDGGVRKVVIEHIAKEDKVSQKGNNYILHTYTLKDVETQEEEVLADRDFAFTNALGPVKKQLGTDLRLGVTVLKVTTTKKGEREYNGVKYPQWTHEIEMVDNPIGATTKPGEDKTDVGSIPF
jgi:hypothetical protein